MLWCVSFPGTVVMCTSFEDMFSKVAVARLSGQRWPGLVHKGGQA